MNETMIGTLIAELRRNQKLQREEDQKYWAYQRLARRTSRKAQRWLAEERVRQLAGM